MANGIKQRLNKSFSNVYDWFIDNKLIYFVEEKMKKKTKTDNTDIRYDTIHIK